MIEIPRLTENERFNIIVGMTLGSTYAPIWFLEKKYGEKAVEEYLRWGAEEHAQMLKAWGFDTPLKLLIFCARGEREIYRSDVELEGDENKVIMKVNRCTRLHYALQWAEIGEGPEKTITRNGYCHICIRGDYKTVAEALGFKYDVEFTPIGCKMTISK